MKNIDDIKQWIQENSVSRYLIVGVFICIAGWGASTLLFKAPPKDRVGFRQIQEVEQERVGMGVADLTDLENVEQESLREMAKMLQGEVQKIREQSSKKEAAMESAYSRVISRLDAVNQELQLIKRNQGNFAPVVAEISPSTDQGQQVAAIDYQGGISPEMLKATPEPAPAEGLQEGQPEQPPQPQMPVIRTFSDAAETVVEQGQIRTVGLASDDDGAESLSEPEAELPDIVIPAGSIISGTLLTGADLPTGTRAKKNPYPLLMRVKKEAILSNNYTADIVDCFLLSSGYASLASERGYLRAEKISCISSDGTATEIGIRAFATGDDGRAGIRGVVEHRAGAALARAALSGFASGLSEAAAPQKIIAFNNNSGSDGGGDGYQEPGFGKAMQSAAFKGASNAMEKLSSYYIELAESIFPVLRVDTGRRVDFIVETGFQIKQLDFNQY